ncbi:hypothetical protein [Streptomyces sp. NPDC048282]|uniref:hypothetical protein n=1 Tax=Streptomyces sp. NPDC048282 TaxID=3365528 RepID=UPI003722B6E6
MLFRATATDLGPTDLDRAAAYPADGPLPALTAERIRQELAGNQFRPEWIWFAEDGDGDGDGEILARALWWGRAGSVRPIALDCLQVRADVVDPAAVAAGLLATAHAAFGTLPPTTSRCPGTGGPARHWSTPWPGAGRRRPGPG